MMIEKIKEQLSIHFISAIAVNRQFIVQRPSIDYGVDLMIEELSSYTINEQNRYFYSGKSVDIQLKCTLDSAISFSEEELKYDLESKNYNDLIKRHPFEKKNTFHYIPLILILVVLADHPKSWLELTSDQLIINGSAYWYYPDLNESLTINRYSKRISIPLSQKVDLDFFQNLFKLLYQ